MCSGQGDVHITCAPLCTHAVLVAGGTTLHSHPAVPQEMLMSWWLSCWWPGVAWCGGIPTWHHADVVVGMWWGVVCCGDVGGAVGWCGASPCAPLLSSSPAHLLLISSLPAVVGLLLIPVLPHPCAPVLLWGGISPPSP